MAGENPASQPEASTDVGVEAIVAAGVEAGCVLNVDAEVLGAGVELNVGVVLLVGSDVEELVGSAEEADGMTIVVGVTLVMVRVVLVNNRREIQREREREREADA
jgi:hypothetical protein